jgi:hypothetical protein
MLEIRALGSRWKKNKVTNLLKQSLYQTSNNLFPDCYHLTTPSYSSAQPYDNHHITSSYNHLTIDTVLQLLSTWPKTSFSMKPTILTCLQPSRNSSKGPRWKHRFSLYPVGSHTQLWERQSLQSLKEQSLCSAFTRSSPVLYILYFP